MFKRILTAVLCFVLVLGVSSFAFAKTKAKAGEKTVKAAVADPVVEATPETVVQKMSEPKDTLKDKLGLAFTTGGTGSLRMWLTNSLGLDLSANIGPLSASTNTSFGMGLGANIVFPMMEAGPVALYLKPGLSINFLSAATTDILFTFNAALEAEAFVVKNVVSVGGTLGMYIGIDAGGGTTKFLLGLGSSSVSSLFVRIYM